MSVNYIRNIAGLNCEIQITNKRRVCERNQLFDLVEQLAETIEQRDLSKYLEEILINHPRHENN